MATRRSTPSRRTAESAPAETDGPAGGASASTEAPAPRRRTSTTKARTGAASATKIEQSVPLARPIGVSVDARREMIAKAAYLRAERRGFVPGSEEEDWLAAEKEVDALLSAGQGIPQ
jgi:hypothetical protein